MRPRRSVQLPQRLATLPDLFTAFQEQFGMKLQATRAPPDVLVIDTVSRPSGPSSHIADAVAHTPALGHFGAAMAFKDDSVELKSFSFCERAWFLEEPGTESALVLEQARVPLTMKSTARR
jgi:Protein of unknown function (DUF3738)